MAVKLELYRVFKEVAETGNISEAAKNLYISQSAVSQSVKQLETALQARLFARSPRGVTLTGGQVRSLFSLRSACFTTAWDGTQFTFDVTGYGHGVGMSQYGANAMAKSGSGFEDILTWYYTGAQVGELW